MEDEEKAGEGRVPEYYANVVRLSTNINGMTILFGRSKPVGIRGDESATDHVCLVDMSPVQAKSLFLLLRKHLQHYEEEWGKIPVHPNIAENYGEEI